MNLSRIILLLIVLTSSSLSSQTKQDLENQKKQIQQDIKKIELKLKTNSKPVSYTHLTLPTKVTV